MDVEKAPTWEERLAGVEHALLFLMEAQHVSMNISTGLLNAQGQPQMTSIQGSLHSFYQKVRAKGYARLDQLTQSDFPELFPRGTC